MMSQSRAWAEEPTVVVALDDELVMLDEEEEAPPTLRDLATPRFDDDDDPVVLPMTRPLDGPRRLLERFMAWLAPSRGATG